MSCPARVADAHRGRQLTGGAGTLQLLDLALAADDLERAVARGHGDARRVVSAVLEPVQPLDQDVGCLFPTDVADNSAHR